MKKINPVQKVEAGGACHFPETVHQDVDLSADSKTEACQSTGVMKVY